jgi:hypothetical protein
MAFQKLTPELKARLAQRPKPKSTFKSSFGGAKKLDDRPPILPFIRPDLADVAVGQRVATFRPMKQPYYPRVGQLFRAHYNRAPLPGEYKCDTIRHVTLGEARKRYWMELGAEAPEKVELLWIPLFGRTTFQEEHKGYVYLATRIR